MADREEYHSYHSRPSRRGRGARSPQNRVLHHLGITDLREHLDRMRTERGHCDESSSEPDFVPVAESPSSQRGLSSKTYVNSRRYKEQGRDIESPLNIKVEFSTSTGEHVYKLDEATVLPTIKHVPDVTSHRPYRGRGRGRGHGRGYRGRAHNNPQRPPPDVPCEENWDNLDITKEAPEAEHQEYEDAEDHQAATELQQQIENLQIKESEGKTT